MKRINLNSNRVVFLLLALLLTGILNAQTKLGDNPKVVQSGSLLELESLTKGLRLPRIALNDVSVWTLDGTAVSGMVIYNESGTVAKGIYYWNTTLAKWVKVTNDTELSTLTLGAPSSTSYANGGYISGSSLYLAYADGTNPGLISTADQSIAGAKTFTSAITAPTATNTINSLIINAGALSGITGYTQASGNFSMSGTGTFGTGTGAILLNGSTTISGTNTLTVGTGATTLGGSLTVGGAASNDVAYSAGSGTTIDFTQSNLAYTTASAGAFALTGLKDGGTYTLAVQGATSGTASFTQSGMTFKSTNNAATTASTHTVYTFIVMGTTVYYWMNAGF